VIAAATLAAAALFLPLVAQGMEAVRIVCGALAIVLLGVLASRPAAAKVEPRPEAAPPKPRKAKTMRDDSLGVRRLDAAGRVTRSLAHDLNNLFSAILGHSELLLMNLPEDSEERKKVLTIRTTGQRASAIVRQLQDIGLMQAPRTKHLDLSDLISEREETLRTMLPRDIEMVTDLDPLCGDVLADPALMTGVVKSLVENAIDAMPDGGRLTIRTGNAFVDEEQAIDDPVLSPGRYVTLTAADDGTGMSEETLRRAFDPFFTTKPGGRTTGLGLATVYGVLQKLGGHVLTRSEPGEGTTVEVTLPTTAEGPLPGAARPRPDMAATATQQGSPPCWAENGEAKRG
jgi:signal transduction histidine kinase